MTLIKIKGHFYTEQQIQQIKELYVQGYSATLILEKIGTPVSISGKRQDGQPIYDYDAANDWLGQIRKKLQLPKRGTGFQGITRNDLPHVKQARLKKKQYVLKQERKYLENKIALLNLRLVQVTKDLATLKDGTS